MENLKSIYGQITDGICASGANISHIEHILNKKDISLEEKIEKIQKALNSQRELLETIQVAKDKLKRHPNGYDLFNPNEGGIQF